MRIQTFLLSAFACVLASCGGGSGGGGDSASAPALNACESLGLSTKVLNGVACGSLAKSAVVRVYFFYGEFVAECTGTMITSHHVLTAAHCYPEGESINYFGIGTGDATAAGGNVHLIQGKKVFIHPGYRDGFVDDAEYLFNDVAIIELASTTNLPTVPLLISDEPKAGDTVQVYGYGITQNGEQPYDNSELFSGNMKVGFVSPNHVRVDFDGKTNSNVCLGDSGGPLISFRGSQPSVVGVVSFGRTEDCSVADDTYYTNLQSPEVRSFIQSVIGTIPSA